jgi:CheY-like chemotaxis protein
MNARAVSELEDGESASAFDTASGCDYGFKSMTGSPLSVEPASRAEIFVAEDNPADVYLIDQALRESAIEFHMEVASDGHQALSYFRREGRFANAPSPSLILLDLNLPLYDGGELLDCIRADERLKGVPVVVLTSSDSPQDRRNALNRGADHYIRKPSTLAEFMAIGAQLRELMNPGRIQPA